MSEKPLIRVRMYMDFLFEDMTREEALKQAEKEFYEMLEGNSWQFDPSFEIAEEED